MAVSVVITDRSEQYVRYLELLELRPGDLVLEAGCGAGRALAVAQERQPHTRWIGLDRLGRLLTSARQACPGLPLLLGDLRQLPFAAGVFDAIFSRDTLECLPDPLVHLDECARVLRPGGRLLVSHWDWDTEIFNADDLALTRQMVRAFADTQQGWMQHHDPAMGRKLHGFIRRHPGLEFVDAGVTVLLETEWCPGTFGYEQSQAMAQFLPAQGVVSETEAQRWLALVAAAAATGEYLFSANHYWCLARKR